MDTRTPEAPEFHTARDLEMLQELAELGMLLARRVAQRALQDQAEPEPPGEPKTAAARRPDPNLVFARLASCVRNIIALKTRIASGKRPAEAAPEPEPDPDILNDPRRPAIIRYLREAVKTSTHKKPAHADLNRKCDLRTNDLLATNPVTDVAGDDIAAAICKELNLPYDYATMPDELVFLPHDPWVPPEYDKDGNEIP